MSKRFDNKKNLYILGALVILLGLTVLIRIPKRQATLKENLINLDTSRVSSITIIPRIGEGAPFDFTKNSGRWIVKQGDITSAPEKDVVQNILAEMRDLKPKSLEAVDKSRWKEFSVTDSLAIRVILRDENNKSLADLMVGRFSYNQTGNTYGRSGGGGIVGTSYVRLCNEKKIYGIDGFLALSFSGKFNDYRDKSFLKINKEDITKISLKMPGDSSFVLEKKGKIWLIGGKTTDSVAVAGYLNGLAFLNGQEFRDNYKPSANPVSILTVEGNNLLNASVKCYKGENESEFILNSSLNPGIYFSGKREGIYSKLFQPEKFFIPKPPKKDRKK